MAQLPTIASTANRRLMPSARLNVEGATPAAFGAAVGAGLQQIGDTGADAGRTVQQFELAKQAEARRLAEFDRQTTFVNFGAAQATRLEQAKRDLSGPAQDFTKATMEVFDTDAAAFLEKVPEQDRPAWQARMAQLRAGFAGDALRAEFGQRDSYYKTTIGDALTKLQNGAMSRPDKLADWRAQGEQIINTSGLSAQEKLEYTSTWRANVALSAAQGDIERDPNGALIRLGGIDTQVVEVTTGDGGVPQGQFGRMVGITLQSESGNRRYGADGKLLRSPAGALGEMQVMPGTNRDPGFGVRPAKDSTPEEMARVGRDYLAAMLRRYKGDAAKAWAAYNAGPGTVDKAVEARGAQWLAGTPAETQAYVAKNMRALGTQGPDGSFTTVVTGNGAVDPRYADLPASARAQLIGSAHREVDRREQAVQAAERQAHEDWLNSFMTDLLDGKAGAEDIAAARASGRLTDANEIVRAQNVVASREQQNDDLTTYNAMWAANQQFNPYDDDAKRAVEVGYKQAVINGNNPAAAVSAIWQRTGILPESGGAMLRGGLVSTDPNRVAAAASVAANMLQRNPNAFAGVQGGSDIEQAAALYSHYVNDLGLTAQDAAQRVAQRNAPEVRRKIDVNKPAVDEFRKTLRQKDVGNMLSNAFGGWFSIDPEFTAPAQRSAAAQDYADFAADHFERHGDAGAAETYAMSQMKKLYGAVNGRLMKFPPTRAYPPVAGSHDYVLQQAQGDIKAATGRDIPLDRVYLMPIPGATAEAFRAGREVPYALHYIDEVDGQQVFRTIPGQAFTASVPAARRAAGVEFGRQRGNAQGYKGLPLSQLKQKFPKNEGESNLAYQQRLGRIQWKGSE